MTDSPNISFVRHVPLPPSPSPVAQTGIIKWMRENLFSSIINSILTILSIFFVVKMVIAAAPWAWNGVWTTSSLRECRELLGGTTGACWSVLTERWNQLVFGFTYPTSEYWRPTLAFVF